ncbi:hypothetical protein SCHPADRAFT_999923 [Schizopora paradoxa]|uniref:Nucleoside transporter n=1 Tax=Schizopora paradoxa TaxID=27342 RepID=A0A0H2RYU0_9AGAM|nr:hypothetical protein SCHPADRAFT_999923 [Schizopora paradoxa]
MSSGYEPLSQSPHVHFEENEGEDGSVEVPSPLLEQREQTSGRIRWIYFTFGAAVLLPWNVLITAIPFFLSRLIGSDLRSTFSSYLSITFTLANFAFLAHATATSQQSSPSRRTQISAASLAILNLCLTFSTSIPSSASPFFAFVLLNAVAQACAGSYLQTATVATASLFGSVAMQAMMAGQAFVGVVVSAVQLLSTMASVRAASIYVDYDTKSAEARAAALFFGLSTFFLICTLFTHAWLVRLPEYRDVVVPIEQAKKTDDAALPGIVSASEEKGRILRVAKMNFEYEFAVAYVFIVTLAVFPPITTSIMPTSPSFNPLIFNALHFLLFNVGDLAGRYLCAVPKFTTWSSRRLVILSLLRTLFIPIFLLCNLQPPTAIPNPLPSPGIPPSADLPNLLLRQISSSPSPVINSDFLFFLILLAFGLSNGYVSSMCMMAAPNEEHNPRLRKRGPSGRSDVDIAATTANFCLIGGLVVGSAASFAVRAQVCNCNPFTQ